MLYKFNRKYYKNVLHPSSIISDEIAIKDPAGNPRFYFVAKKNKTKYLIPSESVENMPLILKPENKLKIEHKEKAFVKLVGAIDSVKIKPTISMTYREMIDKFLPYEHEQPLLFTLYKIIVDAAYCHRINARIMTNPGWLKDSPVTVLRMINGDTVSVNKPTIAKLKYLIAANNMILALNEVQNLDKENKADLSKFYEDTGDFKPEFENPSRRSGGSNETSDIRNLSTLTFYNFPDKSLGEDKTNLFDYSFHDKIKDRVIPFMFKGGVGACKQQFGYIKGNIKDDEMNSITDWLRNHKYYAQNHNYHLNNYSRSVQLHGRWQRNWETIMYRLDMYCESQAEFMMMEQLLFECHKDYLDYINLPEDDDEQGAFYEYEVK